jgi:lysozyme family protein
MTDFDRAIAFTLKWEVGNSPNGGYSFYLDDPGGETKWGISKRYHPNVDIKNLTLEGAKEIYWKEYWERMSCDLMEWPLDLVVCDSAVIPGPGATSKFLTKSRDWRDILMQRIAYFVERPGQVKEGWLNRCVDLYWLAKEN